MTIPQLLYLVDVCSEFLWLKADSLFFGVHFCTVYVSYIGTEYKP
jgi:hypothetical protein